jgi:hypothetical protein
MNEQTVSTLISDETLRAIGARDPMTKGADWAQWRIDRPRFVTDPGTCMLLVTRKEGRCTVGIGRQGMCADIFTEALETGVEPDLVDATVVWLCLSRYGREAVAQS